MFNNSLQVRTIAHFSEEIKFLKLVEFSHTYKNEQSYQGGLFLSCGAEWEKGKT